MDYFPIAISLKKKRVLVIGAGAVALRKIKKLVKTGAIISVIAPDALSEIKKLAKKRIIKWVQRPVRNSDIDRASLAIAATDCPVVNKNISQWARKKGILVNVVDRARLSDFISPALLQKRKALIAVYTDGKDPVFSRDLKNYLKNKWNDFLSYRNRL